MPKIALDYKVFDQGREFVASCPSAEAAAVVVGAFGVGAYVKYRHAHIIWREGSEGIGGLDHAPTAAGIMRRRIERSK